MIKYIKRYYIYNAIILVLIVGFFTLELGEKSGERNTNNDVSLNPKDVNSYRSFAPELEKTIARMPKLDPETQLYVKEVKPNLFYVTGGVYQSAFLKTGAGVIVFDASSKLCPQVTQSH